MRVRTATTTTALSLTTVTVLALPACSPDSSEAKPAASAARAGAPAHEERQAAPLSSAALETLLLDESDLGSSYTRMPERAAQHDDVTILGCPALKKLDGDAATGGLLNFPRKAKASFTHTPGTGAEVSEKLYSDSANKLSEAPAGSSPQ